MNFKTNPGLVESDAMLTEEIMLFLCVFFLCHQRVRINHTAHSSRRLRKKKSDRQTLRSDKPKDGQWGRWRSWPNVERLPRTAGWDLSQDFLSVLGPLHCATMSKILHLISLAKISLIYCLNDCCSVAPTLPGIKDKLVGKHITTLPLQGFDSYQFACKGSCSTEGAVVTVSCDALSLQRKQGKLVQMFLCGSQLSV